MKKISKKIIAIFLIATIILPFYSVFNKVEASEYTTTTTISDKAQYISDNKGLYNGEKITDVIYESDFTEYRWKYVTIGPEYKSFTIDEVSFKSVAEAQEWYNTNMKNKKFEDYDVISYSLESNNEGTYKITILEVRDVVRSQKWTEWQKSEKNPPLQEGEKVEDSQVRKVYNIKVHTEHKSSNDGNGNSSENEVEKIYTSELSVGEKLKFTGTTWHLRNDDKKVVDGKYLTEGVSFEILEIDENYLKISIIAGENSSETAYIKYGEEAVNGGYFTKVESASVGNIDASEEKTTETIDGNKTINQLLNKIYSGYYNLSSSDKNESMENMINDYVSEIESGKSTIYDIIEKLIPEDKLDLGISDEEYLKRLYKAFTLVENPTNDSSWNTLLQNEVKKSRAQALESILTSKYPSKDVNFKALCEKYGINDGNVIGSTISYVKENSNKENIEKFVKDLISKSNIKISDEDKTNLIENIISGQFSASTAVKTIVESNEFKNLKLTDADYIKVIGKICLNEELSDSDIQNYEKKLVTDTTRNELLKEFILNNKFQTICDNLNITRGDYTISSIKSTGTLAGEFIKNAYTSLTGKDASNIGSYSGLVKGEQTATEVLQMYVDSATFKNRKLSDEEYVNALFKAALNRSPSQDEINAYVSKIKESNNMAAIDEIVKTEEFKKRCNQYYLTAGKYVEYITNDELVQIEQKGTVQIIKKEKTSSDGKKIIYLQDVIFDLSDKVKGDVNSDKAINIEDASFVLTKAVALTLNDKELTEDESAYVDIDGDGMITVKDAQYILTYYVRAAVGFNNTWEEIVSGNFNDDNTNNENTTNIKNELNYDVNIEHKNSLKVLNESQLNEIIEKTEISDEAKKNMKSVTADLVKFQNQYKVNAVYVMACIYLESIWGTQWDLIDSSTYNWCSIKGSANGGYIDRNGTSWNKYSNFSEATEHLFKIIADVNGYYFGNQKYTIKDICEIWYASNDELIAKQEAELVNRFYKSINVNPIDNSNGNDSSTDTDAKQLSFLEAAKFIKEQVANQGYTYGHQDPRNSKQINCATYIAWSLIYAGYDATCGQVDSNAQDKNKTIDNTNILKKYCDKNNFQQIYSGKTLNPEEIKLEPGDIIFEGSGTSENELNHAQIYAGKNNNGENIWYSCGSDLQISKQPGTDTESKPYAEGHYIVYVYRVPNKTK